MTLLNLFHRWLDKLGIAALTNHTRVFRQAFVGGHYSLLDSDQNPLPVSPNSDIIFIWHVKHAVVLGHVPRERGGEKKEGEVKYSSPVATVHLGLLALSVVQETGWHQGAQCDKCSGRRSLYQSLRTLCQDTVSHNNFILCV